MEIESLSPRPTDPVAALMKRPLILGASVSADYNSMSPGKKLALQYTSPSDIRTLARGGRMGRDTMMQVNDSSFEGRTIVIALDLFFWDSTAFDFRPSLDALHRLFSEVSRRKLPVVVGDVPLLLMPGYQRQRDAMNDAIRLESRVYPRCQVMPFDEMREELAEKGYLVMNGRKMTLREIVPDGLHLSDPAGDWLRDQLLGFVRKLPAPGR